MSGHPHPRKSKRNNKRRNPNSQGSAMVSLHPPPFMATKRFTTTARYLSSAAASAPGVAVTRACLLNHLIMNINNNESNYRYLSGVRLKNIKMWSSTATLGSVVTNSVEWTSTYGPSTIKSDTSVGTAVPAFVSSAPPVNSLARMWSLTGSNESDVLCLLQCPTNTIVDVTLECTIFDRETPVNVTSTNSGTTGQTYVTYLDGITNLIFVPVSYASLT